MSGDLAALIREARFPDRDADYLAAFLSDRGLAVLDREQVARALSIVPGVTQEARDFFAAEWESLSEQTKDIWRSRADALIAALTGPRCWCGGEVGPRVPGDASGLGCLENINHDYAAQQPESSDASPADEPQRFTPPRDFVKATARGLGVSETAIDAHLDQLEAAARDTEDQP